jgi:hypothetical protein
MLCAMVLLPGAGIVSLNAQFPLPGVPYTRGQDVSPTFEGWESNPDGTFNLWFGYFNRNSEEEVDVPIGPDNHFDLGDGDQEQPAHFYAGRRWFVFKVVVPKDWPGDKRLVWTLTNRGRTNQAKGWLQPEWEVDKELIIKDGVRDPFNRISSTPLTAEAGENILRNIPPAVTGSSEQTITLPDTATLKVTATDDGIPKPVAETGGRGRRAQGVQIRWILYRGPAKVQFDPEFSPAVYGKPLTAETKVSFSAPGTYRLRAIATDGWLFTTFDVDVKVNPATSAGNAH